MSSKFKITNMQTGEDMQGIHMYVLPKQKVAFKEFMFLNQEYLDELLDSGFDGNTIRVLLALLRRVDFGNKIPVTQSEIAERLGMDVSNFTRYVSKLVKAGIVIRDGKSGRNAYLSISTDLVWKGSPKSHKEAISKLKKSKAT